MKDSYARLGYVCLDDVALSDPELAAIRIEAEELAHDARPFSRGAHVARLAFIQPNSGTNIASHLDGAIHRFAAMILGDSTVPVYASVSCKLPGEGEWEWHQDYRSWQALGYTSPRMLTIMLFLTKMTTDNGCLALVPQSHGLGLLPHRQSTSGQFALDGMQVASLRHRWGLQKVEGDAGGAAIFDCNLVHGSSANMTTQPRTAVQFVYTVASNVPTKRLYGN
jgi:ectoine hydroxylase-related dioxygenase (phytanoyl-CoA dioxygenase family)